MMKTCGIVAEYNPFHNGHLHHIEQTRKLTGCECLIALMSGYFVQRGEPALIDKWRRAAFAVQNGVDVVIELPFLYAVQSAGNFAEGAISLLKRARVDALSFGSECGDMDNLLAIASTPVNPDHLRASLDKGMSFPEAYGLLTGEMMPNDILAVAYLKQLEATQIKPYAVKRTSNYNDPDMHRNASALAIRQAVKDGLPYEEATPMASVIAQSRPVFAEHFWPYLRTLLLTETPEHLKDVFLVDEGIENHLVRHADENETWDGFLSAAVTRRYTASRIRRTCLQIMMHNTKEDVKALGADDTLRVLAFNDTGRLWLRQMKESGVHPASRFGDIPRPFRKLAMRECLLYTSVTDEAERKRLLDRESKGAHYLP